MSRDQNKVSYLPPGVGEDDYEYEIIEETVVDDPRKNRGGCRGCLGGCGLGIAAVGLCISVPLVALAVSAFLGVASVSAFFDGIADFFRGEPRQATVTTSRTIINSIQLQGTLVTVGLPMSNTDVRVSVRDGFQNTCGFSASHAVEGTIEAGFDLTQITMDDIDYNAFTQTYTVTLPAPHLTSCRIEQIRQYNPTFTMCAVDWDDARQIAQYEALIAFRDGAIQEGILDLAEGQVEAALNPLLSGLVGEANINFDFAAPDPDAFFVASCDPLPPRGWEYDARTGSWSD